jgi:Carbohydrate binding module (family 6)/Glycosyl hydrolases family 43
MNKLTFLNLIALLLAPLASLQALNPLNSGIGPTFDDPHGVVFDDRVYLFTSDDFSPKNKGYVMKDWRVWSSSDLVSWKLESTLKPEETFIGKTFNDCWATFGVRKNGKYYWYFSAGPREIGVAVADSPAGPWKDPLGKPLVPLGLTPTDPYTYKGSVITPERVAPEFRKGHLYDDRHGNFFTFNKQWYYACNDYSQPGRTPYYRDSIMAYVHYKDNGEIAPVRIDRIGVGEYDASQGQIEAEDYFKSVKAETRDCSVGGFEMRGLAQGSELYYPNVLNLPADSVMTLSVASASPEGGVIEVREGKPDGRLLGSVRVANTGGWNKYQSVVCQLNNILGKVDLCLVFTGNKQEFCRLDWLVFAPQCPAGTNKK